MQTGVFHNSAQRATFRLRSLKQQGISVRSGSPSARFRSQRKKRKNEYEKHTMRNPDQDIMLAPGNPALILIDYQPPQISTVESIDRRPLINNVVAVAKTEKLQDLPIILSSVNVSNGVNEDTIPELAEVLKTGW